MGIVHAKFDGKTGMEILMEETDPEAFELLLDLYWVQSGGADPIEWINKLKGRMKLVHLKDFAVWAQVEQDECYGRDPFACLATSFNNLKKLEGNCHCFVFTTSKIRQHSGRFRSFDLLVSEADDDDSFSFC